MNPFYEPIILPEDEATRLFNIMSCYTAVSQIYSSLDVNVYRSYEQVTWKAPYEIHVAFFAARCNHDEVMITGGVLKSSLYSKIPELEKIGKRLLIKRMKEQWSITF